jgi:aquaporin Z
MEAVELALFMVSACAFALLLFHPASPAVELIESPHLRRALNGLAMGGTAAALIYSPLGQRSGAHMNPATTTAFWFLGRVVGWDAVFYGLAQFAGAASAMLLLAAAAGGVLADPSVHYVATLPGRTDGPGLAAAWLGEFAISFVLLLVVLAASNHRATTRWTGVFAGMMVATWITLEAPVSGMSMNPARSVGSALAAGDWPHLWIYFTAPPSAMLAAAWTYARSPWGRRVYCAKLNHCNGRRCIFRCGFGELMGEPT